MDVDVGPVGVDGKDPAPALAPALLAYPDDESAAAVAFGGVVPVAVVAFVAVAKDDSVLAKPLDVA